VPDSTLGAESSRVTPDGVIQGIPSDQIDGGAIRGANLFHSFEQLSVLGGRGAYFTNPTGIANILARVTGATRSEILGRLGVLGNANLLLINPNGIVFGPNASLDVQGSFLATTASSFMFPDGSEFSAINPQAPSLLMVNVPLGLQYGSNPGSIQVQGANLQVNPGRTLALVGGDVSMDGGQLQALGGRIELGGVAEGSTVGLVADNGELSLSFPNDVVRRDVFLTNDAFVVVIAGGGGSIAINTRDLTMTGRGALVTGIEPGSGSVDAKAGDIEINATGAINLSGSGIVNVVAPTGVGEGGNINITTGSLSVTNGSQLQTGTFGQGNVGNVNILARDTVSFEGVDSNGFPSAAFSSVQSENAVGNGGNINIISNALRVTGGATLYASTSGQGNAGSININAADTISLNESEVFSSVERGAEGNGGNINITTGSLFATNGTRLNVSTSGQGNGGQVIINARDHVSFDGVNGLPTAALSNVEQGANGNAGGVSITTKSLSVTNGALLESRTRGQGNGGSININAADTISFDESGAFSSVEDTGIGNGGSINITSGSLSLTNDATLVIKTSGEGDAGSISVNAGQIFMGSNAALIGDLDPNAKGRGGNINLNVTGTILLRGGITTPTPGFLWTGESTRITIGVLPGGVGSGGTLNINAGSLVLTDGAIVKNSTQGQGEAGAIYVNADIVDIAGSVPSSGLPSGLFTSTDTDSSAGDIAINTQIFRIADGAALSARSKGDGQGGNITVNATSFEAVNGGQLITTTFGRGQAGNIFVNSTNKVTISGSDPNYTNRIAQFPSPISSYIANAITETGPSSGLFANTEASSTGNGGNIEVVTSNFNLTDSAQISASSSGSGKGGNLTINTGNLIARNGTIATFSQQSTGGEITVTADRIRLFGDSDITTNVNSGAGGGGNIYLEAGSIVALDDSDILAYARDGRGGDITLDTPAFFGQNYRPAPRNTNPDTLDRNDRVDINASGAVSGVITTPDTSFIQNSFTELPGNPINTDSLLANSCIVRRNQPSKGTFFITGTGGLPQRPGDAQMSTFPTVDIATLPRDSTFSMTNLNRPWQKGDPIVEPQGVYRLPNGKLVLSRECP
jgi:filamentous hemagglutinin family protein